MQAVVFAGETELGLAGAGMIGLAGSIRAYGDRVDAIVTQTLYPAICAVKDRTDLLFEAFVKSNRLGLMWGDAVRGRASRCSPRTSSSSSTARSGSPRSG